MAATNAATNDATATKEKLAQAGGNPMEGGAAEPELQVTRSDSPQGLTNASPGATNKSPIDEALCCTDFQRTAPPASEQLLDTHRYDSTNAANAISLPPETALGK